MEVGNKGTEAKPWGGDIVGVTTNCRNRMEPPLGTHYFGKAVLPVFAVAKIEEVLRRELSWCAQLLQSNLVAFGDEAVRREMKHGRSRRSTWDGGDRLRCMAGRTTSLMG